MSDQQASRSEAVQVGELYELHYCVAMFARGAVNLMTLF